MALLTPETGVLRRAARVATLAGLLWIPQAWLAASAIAALIRGGMPQTIHLLGFLGLAALRAALGFRADGQAQSAARAATGRLRHDILNHEISRARPAPAGQVASLVSDQAEMLQPYAARYLSARLRAMVLPLAILLVSLWVAWAAGLILLLTGPAIPVFMALIGQAAGRASRAQLQQMGTMGALLADRAAALADIRLLGAGERLIAGFTRSADELRRRTMRVLSIAFLSSAVLELFASLGIALLAVFCGFTLLGQIGMGSWPGGLSVQGALFLLLMAPEFYQPMRDFAAVWHDRAAADALAQTWAGRQRDQAAMIGAGAAATPLARDGISLRGVSRNGIVYPDIDLPEGVSVAVTGPSGAGKTTLLRLIAGLEAPDTGQIIIGGQALDGDSADAWRAGLGWMAQAPRFIDASVAENLRMGRTGDIDGALRQAVAQHIVAGLPAALDTRLGENGAGVSGGEARRLMLARAILARPRLILADEPTADLDDRTAAQVTRGLLAAHQDGAGLIVATHDPALAARMALRIDLGRIDLGRADLDSARGAGGPGQAGRNDIAQSDPKATSHD